MVITIHEKNAFEWAFFGVVLNKEFIVLDAGNNNKITGEYLSGDIIETDAELAVISSIPKNLDLSQGLNIKLIQKEGSTVKIDEKNVVITVEGGERIN